MTLEEIFDLFKRADLIEAEVSFDEHEAQVKVEQAAKAALAPKPVVANNTLGLQTTAPHNPGVKNPNGNPAKV